MTTICNEEEEVIITVDVTSGCMRWYVFSEDATTYTMILGHNLLSDTEWISQDDYEQTNAKTATPESVGMEYPSGMLELDEDKPDAYNNRRPITLLKKLKDATNDREWLETLTKYEASWECAPNSTQLSNCGNGYIGEQHYVINYTKYKARLISAEEINEVTRKGKQTAETVQGGSFLGTCSSNCSKGSSSYGWLFDYSGVGYSAAPFSCESYGCNEGYDIESSAYWTESPVENPTKRAWNVYFNGGISYGNVDTKYGVRPVIKVSKTKLGLQN